MKLKELLKLSQEEFIELYNESDVKLADNQEREDDIEVFKDCDVKKITISCDGGLIVYLNKKTVEVSKLLLEKLAKKFECGKKSRDEALDTSFVFFGADEYEEIENMLETIKETL